MIGKNSTDFIAYLLFDQKVMKIKNKFPSYMIKTNEFPIIIFNPNAYMSLVSYFCGSMSDIQQQPDIPWLVPSMLLLKPVFQKFLQAALELLQFSFPFSLQSLLSTCCHMEEKNHLKLSPRGEHSSYHKCEYNDYVDAFWESEVFHRYLLVWYLSRTSVRRNLLCLSPLLGPI